MNSIITEVQLNRLTLNSKDLVIIILNVRSSTGLSTRLRNASTLNLVQGSLRLLGGSLLFVVGIAGVLVLLRGILAAFAGS
jgi:hypothetical protein